MLVVTTLVALFKRETIESSYQAVDAIPVSAEAVLALEDPDEELDAAQLGIRETYHRLWEVCKLPAVRWLFLVLLTYRLPTALSDHVKLLKAVEFGLSKSTTALLSPTLILPLGIAVPIIANRIWHDRPLRQFLLAYGYRVTLVPLLDVLLLSRLKNGREGHSTALFWLLLVMSTAAQAIVNSLQFNAQMSFFAHRVDPAIGATYMTLLNTAANLGGTWPSSIVMWAISRLSTDPICRIDEAGQEICTGGWDPYFTLQLIASGLGCLWIFVLGKHVQRLEELPDDAWRTHASGGKYQGVANANDLDPESLESTNVDLRVHGVSPGWVPHSHLTKGL